MAGDEVQAHVPTAATTAQGDVEVARSAGSDPEGAAEGEARTKLADVEASEQSKVGVQGQVGVSGSVGTDPEKE
jgi:hypothetical protein